MEPVEINAGEWYLRAPRADDRVDDRPALAELGETDPGYVARCAADWAADTRYTWAVSEPLTGELLAEVILDPVSGALSGRSRTGHHAAAQVGLKTVCRFASAALALEPAVTLSAEAGSTDEDPGDTAGAGE